jgi:RimJ/RimL family protein N-acetyltransferase
MTRCSSEAIYPCEGLGWRPPSPIQAVLDTPRLVIRPYVLEDVAEVHAVVGANRDYLDPWMPWARRDHEIPSGTARYVSEKILDLRRGWPISAIGLAITERSSGRFIGGTGVHDIRPDTASCETGYWIAADAAGRGYAGEACRRTISWALAQQPAGLGLRRVRLYCSGANARSVRVIEKLGIAREVTQRGDYWVEGHGCTDRLGWGVLAEEWDCAAHASRAR